MDYSSIKGFNYQPSYGSSGLELWRKFDAAVIDKELGLGKKYFPRMNAIRLWLSSDAFDRKPRDFADNFDEALDIAAEYGLVVMPVLFNRWHDNALEYGGVFIDHFMDERYQGRLERMFVPYLEAVVGGHAKDARIFAWDLCNEPFSYDVKRKDMQDIIRAEYAWLEEMYRTCKRLGAEAPLTVGIHPGHGIPGIEQIEPISDILSIHPYWFPGSDKQAYTRMLDDYVAFAKKVGKPLLATETCWGSLDDRERVETIRFELGEEKKRGIGWLAYALHHSLVPDLHRPEFGPVGGPGYLAFIEADGTLRPGHEVYNEY